MLQTAETKSRSRPERRTSAAGHPPKLAYRIDAFAEATGISRSTVYAEIRSGRLRAKRRGAHILITAEDAAAYLDGLSDVPASQG